MDKENIGCFTWIVRFKQSCNERWARFRNRLRRRFYARRGQTIDPSTIANESGTRDMVITKTPYRKNKVLSDSFAAPIPVTKECLVDVGSETDKGLDESFEKQVEVLVSCIITKAADTLYTERQMSLGNKYVTIENSADNVSQSSSVISQMANIAVRESLPMISLGTNINPSVIHKTIKEFMVQTSLELLAEKWSTVNLLRDYAC